VVHFNVGRMAEGGFDKIKGDYLGYQFWSPVYDVLQTLSDVFTIPHQEVAVTVDGFYSTQEPIQGVKVYLFTASGSYVGLSGTTDASGQVRFSLPDRQYKVRVDYLGNQFWSDVFQSQDITVTINEGLARVHVHRSGVAQQGLNVYLFSASGSYLSRSQTTDASGEAEFVLPDRSFKFRVDQAGTQYWSGVVNIIAGEENPVDLDLDQLALIKTNNLNPARFDGVPPVHKREEKRLAGLEGLVGIVPRAVVGYTATPKVYYYLNDQLGTPQLMVDSTGTVVWEARYKPFGEAQVHSSSTVVNNFRFPGQYYDQETGLHYNWHRYYDPRLGRYLTADPIGLGGGINLSAYCRANPLLWNDPYGLRGYNILDFPDPLVTPFQIYDFQQSMKMVFSAGYRQGLQLCQMLYDITIESCKSRARDYDPCRDIDDCNNCAKSYFDKCRSVKSRWGSLASDYSFRRATIDFYLYDVDEATEHYRGMIGDYTNDEWANLFASCRAKKSR
jgi:RHS repeat-associated protein